MSDPTIKARVTRLRGADTERTDDTLAVEEPLEIRLAGKPVAVVMRTPGHDRELAAGFMFTEGIAGPGDIGTISSCDEDDALNPENVVDVRLVPGVEPSGTWERNFYASSSCGICGKASIEAIHVLADPIDDATRFERRHVLGALPTLRGEQTVFEATGGLHAAGLFDAGGNLVVAREDVGRHNAVDKVIGHTYLRDHTRLSGHMLIVSGRQSFEIVQKALVAGIPMVAGVSAASSLAVDLATESNMTLAGFLRDDRLVVYAGAERVV